MRSSDIFCFKKRAGPQHKIHPVLRIHVATHGPSAGIAAASHRDRSAAGWASPAPWCAEREVEDVGQVPGAEPGVHHLGRHTQLQVVTLRVDDLSRSAVLELLQGRINPHDLTVSRTGDIRGNKKSHCQLIILQGV